MDGWLDEIRWLHLGNENFICLRPHAGWLLRGTLPSWLLVAVAAVVASICLRMHALGVSTEESRHWAIVTHKVLIADWP